MKREKGQIAVMVALFMLVLIILFSLVADVGKVYLWQKKLEMATDAAALAGGQEYGLKFSSLELQSSAQDQARAVAIFYAGLNGADTNNVTVTFNDELNDTSPGTDQIAETVQVDATMMVPLMFAKIMGIESKRISAQAATRIGGATGVGGAAPWGPPPLDYQECQRYMLKRGQGSQTKVGTGLSNYSALELPGIGPTPGADWYRDNIIPGGKGSTVMLSVGDNIQTEPGNMVNPTGHGVNERLSMCLHTPKCGSGGCNYIPGCPRVVIVPIMNIDQNGKYEIPILRFEAFLLDENSFDKNQEVLVDGVIQPVGNGGVTGIYLGSYMAPSGTAGGLTGGNLGGAKVVHLIR